MDVSLHISEIGCKLNKVGKEHMVRYLAPLLPGTKVLDIFILIGRADYKDYESWKQALLEEYREFRNKDMTYADVSNQIMVM